jgi:hypothetical protein
MSLDEMENHMMAGGPCIIAERAAEAIRRPQPFHPLLRFRAGEPSAMPARCSVDRLAQALRPVPERIGMPTVAMA